MDPSKLAQARRFYHHVYNGGHLKPEDVSYMVQALEEAYEEIELGEKKLRVATEIALRRGKILKNDFGYGDR